MRKKRRNQEETMWYQVQRAKVDPIYLRITLMVLSV